jgi:hypothetical protein
MWWLFPVSACVSFSVSTSPVVLDVAPLHRPELMDRLGKVECRGSENWSSPIAVGSCATIHDNHIAPRLPLLFVSWNH